MPTSPLVKKSLCAGAVMGMALPAAAGLTALPAAAGRVGPLQVWYRAPGCDALLGLQNSWSPGTDTSAETWLKTGCDGTVLVRIKYKVGSQIETTENKYGDAWGGAFRSLPGTYPIVESCHAYGANGQGWGPDVSIRADGSTAIGCSF